MANGDTRDQRTWVVLEVTSLGEQKIDDGSLDSALRRDLDVDESFPVFIPAVHTMRLGRQVTIHLMEGYVFVASGLDDYRYIALERKPYINKVLTVRQPGGLRQLQVLPDRKIQELQQSMRDTLSQDVREGSRAVVTGGNYNNLTGEVLRIVGDWAVLHFSFRSADVIAKVPRAMLVAQEDA